MQIHVNNANTITKRDGNKAIPRLRSSSTSFAFTTAAGC